MNSELSFRKTTDEVAKFVRKHGAESPRRAVLCTYDLHPARFESVLLPELTRRGKWFRTLVLADRAALQKDGVLSQRSVGAGYELAPVSLRGSGVFHPKLIVLQAGTHLLVGIGSANLTPGGFGSNLELMMFISTDSAEGRALGSSAFQFLDELRRANHVLIPTPARQFLERVCVSRARSKNGPILHNLYQPLIDQMAASRPDDTARTAVLSPWHSGVASSEGVEPAVVAAVGRALGARPVVHTEGVHGDGPDLGKQVRVHVLKPATIDAEEQTDTVDDDEDAAVPRPRRRATLHAKAYLAVGRRTTTLWFGSANCTTPALLDAATKQGNVELLLRTDLDRSSRDAFETDLTSMFEPRKGVRPAEKAIRIAPPRGCVLAGYLSGSGTPQTLTLDVVPSAQARTLHIGRSRGRPAAVTIHVPGGVTTVSLDETASVMLIGANRELTRDWEAAHLAPELWEHLESTSIPFPISVPCIPITSDAEQSLDDLLNDLAGRPPPQLSVSRRRASRGNAASDDETERDRELELLTECAHQGVLDRMAVRVELLRQRIARAGWRSLELDAHYRQAIENLNIAPPIREILVGHLQLNRSTP